jgi:SAM-dependent methyltransferase
MWIMGALGVLAGLALLVYVPSLQAVSNSLLLFAGFHLVGAFVISASIYLAWVRRRLASRRPKLSFGADGLNGVLIAAVVAGAAAITVQVAAPNAWPLAFALLALAFLLLAGARVARGFVSRDGAVLPLVNLFNGGSDLVLDLGCGTGRTTVALGRASGAGRIVALDQSGRRGEEARLALLKRNLELAGLAERVTIQVSDLAPLPFGDAAFDAVVSTNVYDHRGGDRVQALTEVRRVLKPGGRFLLVVRTPGWPMFAAINLLSLALTRRRTWRRIADQAGLRIVDEGEINNAWFALLAPEDN